MYCCSAPPRPRREAIVYSRHCERCEIEWFPADKQVKTRLCPGCREADRLNHIYTSKKGWKQAVQTRAKNRCEDCGNTAAEAGAPLHAHHLIPQSEGGEHTLANGRLLCIECHDATHGGAALGGSGFPVLTEDHVELIAQRVVELLLEQSGIAPLLLARPD